MEVGSVKTFSSPPFVRVGKATALSVVLGLLAVVPIVSPVVAPFLALPLAYVVIRWGASIAMVIAMLTGLAVYLVSGADAAVPVFLLVAMVGGALGLVLRTRWRFGARFALVSSAVAVSLVLSGLFVWLVLGMTFTEIQESGRGVIADWIARGGVAGMSSDTVRTLAGRFRDLLEVVPYIVPGLLGMSAVLLGACSLGLARGIFPRMRDKVPVKLGFKQFRLHWGVAYLSIIGLALLLVSEGDARLSQTLMYIGINLLLVSQTLFFIQGLAVIHWLVVDRQVRHGRRVTVYVVAVLAHVLFPITGFFGLFDTWVDYRRRFSLKGQGAGPQN